MSQENGQRTTIRAITISREYGSGGGEIAHSLATKLGWQLLDAQITGRVALRLGMSESQVQAYDERTESFVERLFESMQFLYPVPSDTIATTAPGLDMQRYHEALCQVLQTAVSLGHVVIVGRGAQALLASHRDVLHVRVVAPLPQRIAYVMQREGLDATAAEARILQKEHERNNYLKEHYHSEENDAHLYDLVVNTGILTLKSAVELICIALERKAERLALPEEELGPAAGLARYPGTPADF